MQPAKLQPTQNRILIEIHEPEKVRIHVADSTVVDPRGYVEVLAVGPLVKDIKPGDKVLLQKDFNVDCPKSSLFGMTGKIAIIYDTVVTAVIKEEPVPFN